MPSGGGDTCPKAIPGEDEATAELDEPPDRSAAIRFRKIPQPNGGTPHGDHELLVSPYSRKASLLTQALLTSPELTPMSDNETPHLTSDGGLTSPARTRTPSPPSAMTHANMPPFGNEYLLSPQPEKNRDNSHWSQKKDIDNEEKTKVEETLGRKRCITFACGKNPPSPDFAKPGNQVFQQVALSKNVPPRRPCLLRFACPTKPPRSPSNAKGEAREPIRPDRLPLVQGSKRNVNGAAPVSHGAQQHGPVKADKETPLPTGSADQGPPESLVTAQTKKPFNRVDFQDSEATRFHEFAGPYREDEWTLEQTAYKQKMTINHTLEKENAIRRLAEEAEEEALDEEDEGVDLTNDDEETEQDDDDDNDEDVRYLNAASDDGNQSDDEGGFAESDDGSDDGFGYQFWTPGVTTAATSTDHLEHIRPLSERVASESSIESIRRAVPTEGGQTTFKHKPSRPRKTPSRAREPREKVEDFIIGTLDEDRPLQEAYLSTLEERKRSKQKLIPQDIDPSFPTSDPEAENDGNVSEDEDEDGDEDLVGFSEPEDMSGLSESDAGEGAHKSTLAKRDRPPAVSPRRLHSPPPHRLFGHTSRRLRSPAPLTKRLASPPPSRHRSSLTGSPTAKPQPFALPNLAERPNLTRTASLPRSENPFWIQHRPQTSHQHQMTPASIDAHIANGAEADFHTRGPIDIVQGLEHKKQRRREKYWRLHCQKAHAGKEKERKCQPGRGAQRMREVGKEMQDRFRGYGHNRPNLMLSI